MDAIVFLVDASDRARFPESKNELDSLLTDETLSNCPVLILGNKIDVPGAASEDELRNFFALYGQTTGKVFYIFTLPKVQFYGPFLMDLKNKYRVIAAFSRHAMVYKFQKYKMYRCSI